ncbi:hypothetical protein RFI_00774 [Reticulomyxa filosa]|uniref:Uncharacterized protein n=1 Tax=Reticulomyxa filosa TaxID=46433 RepID=X6PDZ9_RETFI|nr:hypothetical protein RFI_00774 [Reticulomyxa filosa]|eukprot:ETO36289.1 hypothetical protein RFI_00774 [Reticulomyxa filosa]
MQTVSLQIYLTANVIMFLFSNGINLIGLILFSPCSFPLIKYNSFLFDRISQNLVPPKIIFNIHIICLHFNKLSNNKDMDTLSPFETLSHLPFPLTRSQCVLYKQEILIWGGWKQMNCYSYHVLKNQYKFICSYPKNVTLIGHNVIELIKDNKNSNYITLLSFGGQGENKKKHTLVMKYTSVWDKNIKIKNIEDFNKWMPFVNKNDRPVFIGREKDNYHGIRTIITGKHNHLLIITYPPKNIDVFNLKTFQYVNHSILPTDDYIWYHCFVPKKRDQIAAEYELMLFCKATGLLIEYDENKNKFRFQKLSVFGDLLPFYRYAYIQTYNSILFFGGWNDCIGFKSIVSKAVYQYSMDENKWTKFGRTLPMPLNDCIGILNDDKTHIHILGGEDGNCEVTSIHVKTKVLDWIDTIEKEEVESHTKNKKRIYKLESPLVLLAGSMKYKQQPYLKYAQQDLILLQNLFQTKFGYQVFSTYNPQYPVTQSLSLSKLNNFISKRWLNLVDNSNDKKQIFDGLIFVWCGYGNNQDNTLITGDNKSKCFKEIQDVFVKQTDYFAKKPKIFINITYSDEEKGNEDMAADFWYKNSKDIFTIFANIPLKSMTGGLQFENRKRSNFAEIFCQMIEKDINKSLNVIVKHVANTIFDGKFKKNISATYSDIYLSPQLYGNDNKKGMVVIEPLGFQRYWDSNWIRANAEAAKIIEKMIKADKQGLVIVVKNTSEWENIIFPNLIKLNSFIFPLSKFFNNKNKILYKVYGVYVIERKSIIILNDINIDGNMYVVNCEIKCQQNIKITSQLFVTKDATIDRQLRQSILPIQWDTKMNHDISIQLQDLEDKGKELMNNNLLDDSILQLEQYLQLSLNTFGFDHPFVARSYDMIGDVHYEKKDYQQAILYYEKSLKIMLDNVTIDSSYVIILHYNLGLFYSKIEQHDKSIEYYEKSLNSKLKLFGDNPSDIIDWYSALGNAYSNAERFNKAIEYYEKVVKIRLHNCRASQKAIADVFNNLGEACHNKRAYNKAIAYYEKALETYLDIFGFKTVVVANLYNNLAQVYVDKQHCDTAIKYFEKVIEINVSIFGDKNVHITDAYFGLGNAYEKKGESNKAIEYYKKALQMRLDIFGNNNLRVATAHANLADCYMRAQQYDNAIEQYNISIKIRLDIAGTDHLSIANSYCGLGCVYGNSGNYTKSKEYFEKELHVKKSTLGSDHKSVANVYINLGITCRNAREFDKAIEYYEEALKIRLKNFGASHDSVAECYTQLGYFYRAKKQFDKAFTSFEKALEIRLEIFGPNEETVADSYSDLGDTCNRKGLYDKTITYHEKALNIRLHIFGINHDDVVSSYNSLGFAYNNKGSHSECIKYYEKAIQIKRTISKSVNISIGGWCWDLGNTLNSIGEIKKARKYYEEAWEVFDVILGEWNTKTLKAKQKVKELSEAHE